MSCPLAPAIPRPLDTPYGEDVDLVHPPSQEATAVKLWMNAKRVPAEALAKEGCFGGFRRSPDRRHGCEAVGLHPLIPAWERSAAQAPSPSVVFLGAFAATVRLCAVPPGFDAGLLLPDAGPRTLPGEDERVPRSRCPGPARFGERRRVKPVPNSRPVMIPRLNAATLLALIISATSGSVPWCGPHASSHATLSYRAPLDKNILGGTRQARA